MIATTLSPASRRRRRDPIASESLVEEAAALLGVEPTIQLEYVRSTPHHVYVVLGGRRVGDVQWTITTRGWRDSGTGEVSDDRLAAIDALLGAVIDEAGAERLRVAKIPSTYRVQKVGSRTWEVLLGARGGKIAGAIIQKGDVFEARVANVWGGLELLREEPFTDRDEAGAEIMAAFRDIHG